MRNIRSIFRMVLIFAILFSAPDTLKSQGFDSLDIMIGQMVMVGFQGHSIEDDTILLKDIREGRIGGIILYEKNIIPDKPWLGLKHLTSGLKQAATIPLWVAIDQEGGQVNRLKTKYGFPPSVMASYLGELDNEDSTRFYAELTAGTLAGLGINVNFTPDVDLAINPDNPVIVKKGRSYSSDPAIVAKHASIVIKVHRQFGIITALKHFPGHGSSATDTHLDITDVTKVWQNVELEPYKLLIDSGFAEAIMTSHIVNQQLDSTKVPATLSNSMINTLLRDRLNFQGVVFSDDMHMHAISKHYGLRNSIKLSINAGVDVLLFSNNISDSEESAASQIHRMIKEMVLVGEITLERVNQSYERILTLKKINTGEYLSY